MRRRAENNSGTLQLTTPAGGGTRLSWTARPHESLPSVRGKDLSTSPERERPRGGYRERRVGDLDPAAI